MLAVGALGTNLRIHAVKRPNVTRMTRICRPVTPAHSRCLAHSRVHICTFWQHICTPGGNLHFGAVNTAHGDCIGCDVHSGPALCAKRCAGAKAPVTVAVEDGFMTASFSVQDISTAGTGIEDAHDRALRVNFVHAHRNSNTHGITNLVH